MKFSKFTTFLTLLIGLPIGGALGWLFLQSQALWLLVSIAILLALIALWQTPCIKVVLDDKPPPHQQENLSQKDNNKKPRVIMKLLFSRHYLDQ